MLTISLITTTVEQKKDAEKLIEVLFSKKLIACAQIHGPLTSYYRWEGKMASETEYSLGLKTLSSRASEVIQLITQEHPYDLPEILENKFDTVTKEYSEWIAGDVA